MEIIRKKSRAKFARVECNLTRDEKKIPHDQARAESATLCLQEFVAC
jgi:hypothetical protein